MISLTRLPSTVDVRVEPPKRYPVADRPARCLLPMLSERAERAASDAMALLLVVQLSSERARHALRQDCSFAKQQDSPPALPVVV